ncbi:MFS transporter [Streptomyces griseiscabiei]|uniref:MFS transporter n=1 Tax=Streptomyces griseiscabiei TaxID=2993540 RepID=A0ABU4LFR5_9ACTN|nr:MFS transporter [Streptomyces griseiscabiei]MBZ3900416.1 MFS transporter [Streptomyces griseiscabiei]MDX2914584.1 MFS transporter [Streptomyces griseiscabiei]
MPTHSDSPVDTHRAMILTLACASGLGASLQTVVVPLVPEIGRQLGVGTATAGWALTASLLSSAVSASVLGRVSDLRGRRPLILLCLASVVLGSLLCMSVASLPVLILGRVLQGASGALYSLAVSLVREELPAGRVAAGTSRVAGALGVGASLGIVAAGLMSGTGGDYRLAFAAQCLLATVILVMAARYLPGAVRPDGGGRVDWWGAALLSGFLVPWLIALSQGRAWGWSSPAILGAVGVGAVLCSLFVAVELRSPEPLVDLRGLRDKAVLLINCLAMLSGALIIIGRLPVSQFVQESPSLTGYGFGASVLSASLVFMLPGLATAMGGSLLDNRLVRRSGGRSAVIVGGCAGLAGYLGLVLLHDAPWQVMVGGAAVAGAVGIGASALPVLLARHVPAADFGAANGINALSRWIGSAAASATVGALLSPPAGRSYPPSSAYVQVFLFGAVVSAAVVVFGCLTGQKVTRRPDTVRIADRAAHLTRN